MKSTFIAVKTTFEGIHEWSECSLSEVQFLKNAHRHIFYVEVILPVTHDDRQLEFFIVKAQLQDIINKFPKNGYTHIYHLGQKSCEMIADIFIDELRIVYPMIKSIQCKISEDKENAAIVLWSK